MDTVGFAIPSIPPRAQLLVRAINSIKQQTYPVDTITVAYDHRKQGAGPTRNRALLSTKTEWTCFLDDDDWVYPDHVQSLINHANETGADVVFPWFDVVNGTDPFPQFEGLPWDPSNPRIFPIAILGRTELLQQATFPAPNPNDADWHGDDYPFWVQVQDLGGKIEHLNKRTWCWDHGTGNTSGLPSRW